MAFLQFGKIKNPFLTLFPIFTFCLLSYGTQALAASEFNFGLVDQDCQQAMVSNLSKDLSVNVRTGPGLTFAKVKTNNGMLPDGHIIFVKDIVEGDLINDKDLNEKSNLWVLIQSSTIRNDSGEPMAGFVSQLYLTCTVRLSPEMFDACLDSEQESGELVQALKEITGQNECHTAIEMAQSFEELDLSDHQIQDIRPLEHLTQLTRLNLAGNPLFDLSPLYRLESLQSLDISGCGLFGLEGLGFLPQLQELNAGAFSRANGGISINHISDISTLSQYTNLQVLDLSYNDITNISSLAMLPQLRAISLKHNYGLENILPLSALTELESLDLSYAIGVSSLEVLGKMSRLKELHLDGLEIKNDRQFSTLTSLAELSLESAIITNRTLIYLPVSLKVLDLSWTGLTMVGSLSRLKNLEVLKLQGMSDQVLLGLPIFPRLRGLDLGYSLLTSSQVLRRIAANANLVMLNLETNEFKGVSELRTLGRLTDLNIENNLMASTESLKGGFISLRAVWLNDNPLTSMSCPFRDRSICHFEPSYNVDCLEFQCQSKWTNSWQDLMN